MSNQLPYPLTPTGFPQPYQTEDNNMNNPYPGASTNLPYPAQAYPVNPYPPLTGNPYLLSQQPASQDLYPSLPNEEPTVQLYPLQTPYPPNQVPYPPYPGHSEYPPVPNFSTQQTPYPTGPDPGQIPYPPLPSQTGPYGDLGEYSSSEPQIAQGQTEVNEGKSGLTSKLFDRGLKVAKGAMDKTGVGRIIPIKIERPNSQPQPGDTGDGNASSSGGGRFSGHKPQFQSGQGDLKKWSGQDYEKIKRKCKSRGVLFEDPEFPAANHLLVDDNKQYVISYFGRSRYDPNSIEWLRPHEICQRTNPSLRPKMIVGEADRFDINQGEVGDCWFLAALANLAEYKKCFNRVVPSDQDFDRDYAGIFRFRFWRFGEWVEVVVDDRLPTRKGKLIYLRSVEINEFWGALLEKAYAKLHGSYKALEGGLTIEAAVDFTGGIPEIISLDHTKYSRERLFYMMTKADSQNAFMGCALTSDPGRQQNAKRLGLQSKHAYTITKVVEIRGHRVRGGIPLIRLRNPHGNAKEWKGDWSDGDRHWQAIPRHLRNSLGLTFEDDGEFYMSFRDFLTYFGELEICHLTPDSVNSEDNSKKFEVFHFYGAWKFGSTAGGCGNDGNQAFSTNPQFFINLNDPDPYDDITKCPVIISLMQRQKSRKSEHAIGFKIFKCDLSTKRLTANDIRTNRSVDRTDTFVNLREVSKRILLPEGRYCIVPCTFRQGEEGDFVLRVFVEKQWGSSEGGLGHDVTEEMDASYRPGSNYGKVSSDAPDNTTADPQKPEKPHFKKRNRIGGFAMKQLEKNFPKQAKHLKEFYNWSVNSDEEFSLLKNIMKSM